MRLLTPRDRSIFELPQAIGCLLLILNIAAYGLCMYRSGAIDIPAEILIRAGAMHSSAIGRHEYWRLVAYGFLHADLVHLGANMICLILWAGHLEKRIGSLYFMLVYLCALVVAGITVNLTHSGAYLLVGASGAVSGILGALLCLRILGRTDLPAGFFVISIGLNVALALNAPKIDWGAHVAGFVAGIVFCGLLDLVERVNARVLRCKFPEFVKMNGFVVGCALAIYLFERRPMALISGGEGWWLPLAAYVAACLALVKLLDLMLSMKKGLVIVVIVLSAANAAIVLLVADALAPTLASKCPARPFGLLGSIDQIERLVGMACANLSVTLNIVAAGVFALTILGHWRTLGRGIKDVGFVANALRAERQRHQGI